MITTTLNRIREHEPCTDGWKKLLAHLGQDFDRDQEFPLSLILESNGVEDTVWAARAAIQDPDKTRLAIAIACAEAVLPIFEEAFPDDNHPRRAIEVAKEALLGTAAKATSAATSAAYYATNDYAPADAYYAAYYATYYEVDAADAAATTHAAYYAAYYSAKAAKGSGIDLAAALKKALDNANTVA